MFSIEYQCARTVLLCYAAFGACLLISAGCKKHDNSQGKRTLDGGAVDPGFVITSTSKRQIHVQMPHKPANLFVLESYPPTMEPEVTHGRWLVIVWSVYSGQDVHVARSSREIANQLADDCKVGIRPTRSFEDLSSWLSEHESIDHHTATPLWLVLEEGKVIDWTGGMMKADDAKEFVKKTYGSRIE